MDSLAGHSVLVAKTLVTSTMSSSLSVFRTLSSTFTNASVTTARVSTVSWLQPSTLTYAPVLGLRFATSATAWPATSGTQSMGVVSGTEFSGYSLFFDTMVFPATAPGAFWDGDEQIAVYVNGSETARSYAVGNKTTTQSQFRVPTSETCSVWTLASGTGYTLTTLLTSQSSALTSDNTNSLFVFGWLLPPMATLSSTITAAI